MKTGIFFKDGDGTLRGITYDDNEVNIAAVQDQKTIQSLIAKAGHVLAYRSPVLCLIENT